MPNGSLDADVSDDAVRGMVAELRPSWTVTSVERAAEGTDFVAVLAVGTPAGARRVVLKATTAGLVDPRVARSEPRLLELVGRETSIPVPEVFGYCDSHDEYPAPFSLMAYVPGENFEGRAHELPAAARDRIAREAGANLAELHALGPLPAYGRVGVEDGELAVLGGEFERYGDFRDALAAHAADALDALADGGYFPDHASEPERFADLVSDLRAHVEDAISTLPEPDPPTYCHHDYRYGNILVDPETGAANAVLDWANLTSADPVFNLAAVEGHLVDTVHDSDERTRKIRETVRESYAANRPGWVFDESTRERLRAYALARRLDAMACLPLWYPDPDERDRREKDHREFVVEYVS